MHQSRCRIIPFIVDGSAVAESAGTGGLLEGASELTVVKNATDNNEFTLTLNSPAARDIICLALPAVSDCELEIKSVSSSAVVIESFESDGLTVEADADFHGVLFCFDKASDD